MRLSESMPLEEAAKLFAPESGSDIEAGCFEQSMPEAIARKLHAGESREIYDGEPSIRRHDARNFIECAPHVSHLVKDAPAENEIK